jgi:hypothetical protein
MERARRRAEDPDARLVFYWIALNSLYGQASALDEPRDHEHLHRFSGQIASLQGAPDAIIKALTLVKEEAGSLLESQFLYREYWTKGFTDELEERIQKNRLFFERLDLRKMGRLLALILDRIHELRNQIFHGSAKFGSGANRASVEPAVTVLERLLPLFCRLMDSHGQEVDWGSLPCPAKGREGHPPDRRGRATQ